MFGRWARRRGAGTVLVDVASRSSTSWFADVDSPDDLERLIREDDSSTRLICMDGINSMTGNPPDVWRRQGLRP